MLRALLLLLLFSLTGCARQEAPVGAAPAAAMARSEGQASSFMAYQHFVSVEVEEARIGEIFETAQAACHAVAEERCVLLESRLDRGNSATASLRLRASAAGIQRILELLARVGEVSQQSTVAEDLAAPIADAEKKLAMLKDYRAKLQGLLGRASQDVDALIKVNRELAQVQSEIEALAGEHAHLMQRVETEVLTISLDAGSRRALWRPVSKALSDFGGNVAEGLAVTITVSAYLLPALITLLLAIGAVRRLWRRRKPARGSSASQPLPGSGA